VARAIYVVSRQSRHKKKRTGSLINRIIPGFQRESSTRQATGTYQKGLQTENEKIQRMLGGKSGGQILEGEKLGKSSLETMLDERV